MQRKEKQKDIWTKFDEIDRRIIYVPLILVVIYPLLYPIGLPITIAPEVKEMYDKMNAVPEGGVIILGYDFNVAAWGSLGAAAISITQHAFMMPDVKILVVAFTPDGPMLFDKAMKVVDPMGKEYGKDYVNLGFFAGAGMAMVSLAKDMQLAGVDYYGTNLAELSAMDDIETLQDVVDSNGLLISFDIGTTWDYVPNWQAPYDLKMGVVTDALGYPMRLPYYDAGQLVALAFGNVCGASYEKLLNRPGLATASIDAITLAEVLVTIFIVLGNIGYLVKKTRGGT